MRKQKVLAAVLAVAVMVGELFTAMPVGAETVSENEVVSMSETVSKNMVSSETESVEAQQAVIGNAIEIQTETDVDLNFLGEFHGEYFTFVAPETGNYAIESIVNDNHAGDGGRYEDTLYEADGITEVAMRYHGKKDGCFLDTVYLQGNRRYYLYIYAGDDESGGSYHFRVNSLSEVESFQVSSDKEGSVFTNNSQITMNIGETKELYFDFGNTPAQYQDIRMKTVDEWGDEKNVFVLDNDYYFENGTLTIRSNEGDSKDKIIVYNPYNSSEKFEFSLEVFLGI